MPTYLSLASDVAKSPWDLMETGPLMRSLGIPAADASGEESATRPMRYLLGETVDPREIPQPLELHVGGRRQASLMVRTRGFGREGTLDLIVSPALERVLHTAALPKHVGIECLVRARKKSHPLRWLWWEESFGARLDPRRSLFKVSGPGDVVRQVSYPTLEDYEAACLEAVNTLRFSISPCRLEWIEPAVEHLDLVPFNGVVYISESLAARIVEAKIPALSIRPVSSE